MSAELAKLRDIVNFNEGWFVIYTKMEHKYGDLLPESWFPPGSPRCVVIGEATVQEARRECEFAGVPFIPEEHYYKAMAD